MSRQYSVLDEAWLHYRHAATGVRIAVGLPELFAALSRDEVGDFPALRPHQRHPWHAFLVHLAAIALHRNGRRELFDGVPAWRAALLALTPEQPDDAAWCLVSPLDQPAILQPPVPEGSISGWKRVSTPDALDMLITSGNHDLKRERIKNGNPEDWLYSLVSLQTQGGFLGTGNYGISRMNKGFASRPGLGVVPAGGWGKRWQRDVRVLLNHRDEIAEQQGLRASDGHALLWLLPWDGKGSLAFSSLDPLYIEVCRRVRLSAPHCAITAFTVGSKVARIESEERAGRTGDAWTPVDVAAGTALSITGQGFNYRLASELLFGSKYRAPPAQILVPEDGPRGLAVEARAVTRGQGKTEGYHERRIPISPKTSQLLRSGQTDILAKLAQKRVADIGELRKLLWSALCVLLRNGKAKAKRMGQGASDANEDRARNYTRRFETEEDARFFSDLASEIEADPVARQAIYEEWLLGCAGRAEAVLKAAFVAAPRSGMQRYRARAAALSRLHGSLRGPKSPLPVLKRLYADRHILDRVEDPEDVRA